MNICGKPSLIMHARTVSKNLKSTLTLSIESLQIGRMNTQLQEALSTVQTANFSWVERKVSMNAEWPMWVHVPCRLSNSFCGTRKSQVANR